MVLSFKSELGQYLSNYNRCDMDERETYRDIKCYDVCLSESDKSFIGVSLDSFMTDRGYLIFNG